MTLSSTSDPLFIRRCGIWVASDRIAAVIVDGGGKIRLRLRVPLHQEAQRAFLDEIQELPRVELVHGADCTEHASFIIAHARGLCIPVWTLKGLLLEHLRFLSDAGTTHFAKAALIARLPGCQAPWIRRELIRTPPVTLDT